MIWVESSGMDLNPKAIWTYSWNYGKLAISAAVVHAVWHQPNP